MKCRAFLAFLRAAAPLRQDWDSTQRAQRCRGSQRQTHNEAGLSLRFSRCRRNSASRLGFDGRQRYRGSQREHHNEAGLSAFFSTPLRLWWPRLGIRGRGAEIQRFAEGTRQQGCISLAFFSEAAASLRVVRFDAGRRDTEVPQRGNDQQKQGFFSAPLRLCVKRTFKWTLRQITGFDAEAQRIQRFASNADGKCAFSAFLCAAASLASRLRIFSDLRSPVARRRQPDAPAVPLYAPRSSYVGRGGNLFDAGTPRW